MTHDILVSAKTNPKDEFYTQLEDIEKELKYYKKHFKDKVVFCNCDDPYESNFFKYFVLNFNNLKLKKLICTCYSGSPVSGDQLSLFDVDNIDVKEEKQAYKVELTEVNDFNNDGTIDLYDVEQLLKSNRSIVSLLDGNGDYRSDECLELLKESDIVVTNPPFSLFRDYVATLEAFEKKYIIIGSINAITYREIFPLLKNNHLWLGASIHSGDREFRVPNHYPLRAATTRIDDKGNKYIRVKGVRWFTNLDYKERHEDIPLVCSYKGNEEKYPKYYNYDAINVDKTSDIPCDYFGYIGVPITFMDKYNPDQFDIVGLGISNSGLEIGVIPYIKDHKEYRKNIEHKGAVDGDLYMLDEKGHPVVPYARIIIKRKSK